MIYPVSLVSQSTGPSRIVLIKGVVGSRALHPFVDGGSEVNLIGGSFVPSDTICGSDASLSGLGAGSVPVLRQAPLTIQLGGRKYAAIALVVADQHVPVSNSLLLGLDFLEEHDCGKYC